MMTEIMFSRIQSLPSPTIINSTTDRQTSLSEPFTGLALVVSIAFISMQLNIYFIRSIYFNSDQYY
jgi:hypothetical protein